MNPIYYVFCEGLTEKNYVEFLSRKYRLPIKIISKVAGSDISEQYIVNCKRGKPTQKDDKNFLMYDMDVPELMSRLRSINSTTLLLSNPCIELWFLLHYKNQQAEITSKECLKQLSNRDTYQKGLLPGKLLEKLDKEQPKACARAKALKSFANPSTNLFEFIEAMEAVVRIKTQ